MSDVPTVWVAEFEHPENERGYWEQLNYLGFIYSWYSKKWFAFEEPDIPVEGIRYVEYAESSIIQDESQLGSLCWIAKGDTYPVRRVLKRYGFVWSGRVWYRVGVDEPGSIGDITFERGIV